MSVKIRSVPMVWIFFLSTNRNCFPTESTIEHLLFGPEMRRNSFLSLPNRIFWNFSHKPHFHNAISHIVMKLSKLGQFRWSGFFSYQQTGTIFNGIQLSGIYSRTGTAEEVLLSLPNRIFWNFSHKPHFHNAISHSVRSFKIWSVPMVWIFFLSTNRNFF